MEIPDACARHPGRPAITTCARCGHGVCHEDLVDAPVGYQCRDCADSAPRPRDVSPPDDVGTVTRTVVIALGVVALLAMTGAVGSRSYGLVPALVGLGEWWRLITSAFLHAGLVHLAFNGLLLWNLGGLLERSVGPAVLVGLLAAGTAGGGLGVVALSWLGVATGLSGVPILGPMLTTGPLTVTVGASGAVFGLMGAVLAILRRRGLDVRSNPAGSTVLSLVVLNLVLTFAVPAISVGGHVGGLVGGWLAGHLAARDGLSAAGATTRGLVLSAALFVGAIVLAQDLARRLLG
jgi:membrane associated rhomboid family serine protease